jgi:hypothetical protein
MAPVAQSALVSQSLALQVAPVHTDRTAPEVCRTGKQSVSREHVDVLHLALLQRLLAGHAESPAHVAGVLHLALLHKLLAGHAASPAQAAGVLHFEPVQELLAGHAASPAQVAGVLHLALLHRPPTVQAASPAQLFVAHLAPLQE